jgi:hypothetical protein
MYLENYKSILYIPAVQSLGAMLSHYFAFIEMIVINKTT